MNKKFNPQWFNLPVYSSIKERHDPRTEKQLSTMGWENGGTAQKIEFFLSRVEVTVG